MPVPVSMVVFVAAVVSLPVFAASASAGRSDGRRWAVLQSLAVALYGVAGVVGAVTDDRPVLRLAFAVLALAAAVRLAVIPRQARRRAAAG